MWLRYGKEDKLVNLFGIMQALVSFVQDDKDNLCSIISGSHRFVFVCRGPLVLVAVSKTCQCVAQVCFISFVVREDYHDIFGYLACNSAWICL